MKSKQYGISETLLEQIKDYVLNSHKWEVGNGKADRQREDINLQLKYIKEVKGCKCS